MSMADVDRVNRAWAQHLEEKGVKNYMVYKPFDGYWNERLKIMVCNLETYGYQDCGVTEVDAHVLAQWMKDTHITKTTRNTSVFIHAFQQAAGGTLLTAQQIKATYYQFDRLVGAMSRTCYMNFRKESNPIVSQDVSAILAETRACRSFLKAFILACEPTFLFVGGQLGALSINTVFAPVKRLFYDSEIECEGVRIVSIRHLSRMNYAYVDKKIRRILGQA